MLDLEWTHRSRTCRLPPGPGDRAREARTFLQLLTVYYGKRPVIYTTVDFYRDNHLGSLGATTSGCARWPATRRRIYPGQRWAFWQYTGTGVVSGIDGPTDLNVFAGSPTQFAAWAASH